MSTLNPKMLRVIDANINRAREGLRVLEDTARFVWEDKKLFLAFRSLRHGLDMLTREMHPLLVSSRKGGEDMGRRVGEEKKRDEKGLVPANFKRVAEALRVLEEYEKVIGKDAAKYKEMRYRIYSLEVGSISKTDSK